MKWNTCWNWYKTSDGEFVKLKTNAVKKDSSLVDLSLIHI